MTDQEIQAKIAEWKKDVPPRVRRAAMISSLVGFISLLRFMAAAHAGKLALARATMYGLLMLALFLLNGASLNNRSRWGYIAVAVFALLPVVALFAGSIHVLRLTLERTLANNWSDTILSLIALLQFFVTCVLFRQLLSRDVLDFVWRTGQQPQSATVKAVQ